MKWKEKRYEKVSLSEAIKDFVNWWFENRCPRSKFIFNNEMITVRPKKLLKYIEWREGNSKDLRGFGKLDLILYEMMYRRLRK